MKKTKFRWKNILIYLIILISLIGLITSSYKIIKYKLEKNKTNKQIDIIDNKVTIENIDKEAEIIKQEEEIPKSNPYWDYINMNLIDVNFNELKNINSDVKGWIQVAGTNINYPFVQTTNNQYYLTHSFDKSINSAGWVFLDYRNDLSNFDNKNTIIYGHGRLDKIMFGTLKNILTSGWLNNSNNYIIKLSTEYENTLWQVFSVYQIPTTSDYIQTSFKSNNEFINFTNLITNRSAFNFNTVVSETDRIITLSTCYNNTDKVVLHAKLIKRESKI